MTTQAADVINKSIAVASQQPTHDPVYTGLGWVLILVMLGSAITVGVSQMLRMFKSGGAANAKDEAAASLYNQLSEQIQSTSAHLERSTRENAELVKRVAKLEACMEDYENTKELVDRLKAKLDDKDHEIRLQISQAADERRQYLELLKTKDDKIDHLERSVAELRERMLAGTTVTCPLLPESRGGAV